MYRIGIIGGGQIVQRRHLPEIMENPEAEVCAICDVVKERVEALAAQYHCKAYTDWTELVRDPDLDAVIVAATNTTHAQMTIAALKAGKHVMCEKPMAVSLEEAQEMMRTAEACGKILFIAQNQRLAPAHVKAKQILQSGALGRVITFKSTFGHPGCERWAKEKKKTWFFQKSQSYFGCLADLGIHKIDVVRWMLDDEYTEVYARVETLDKTYEDGTPIDVEDNATMVLKTAKGATGTITVSWTYEYEDGSTVFYGTNGVMTIYGDPVYQIIIKRFDGTEDYLKVGEIPNNKVQVKSGIIDEFVNSLHRGVASISGRDGYEPLKVVFGAYESSRTNSVVKL